MTFAATLFYRGPSLQALHEDYAKKHHIDERAPLQGRREIVVDAPVSRVWRLLSDVAAWDKNLEPGVHDYLEALPGDATRVLVEESMAGPILAFAFSDAKLVALLESCLATLKTAAEAADLRSGTLPRIILRPAGSRPPRSGRGQPAPRAGWGKARRATHGMRLRPGG